MGPAGANPVDVAKAGAHRNCRCFIKLTLLEFGNYARRLVDKANVHERHVRLWRRGGDNVATRRPANWHAARRGSVGEI